MIDHQQLVATDAEIVDISIKYLKDDGDSDAVLNYLYFMRDEINARIKEARQ